MGKCFNVTGACDPQLHYMVDIKDRLAEIKELVDDGAYFTINRARQYGKIIKVFFIHTIPLLPFQYC